MPYEALFKHAIPVIETIGGYLIIAEANGRILACRCCPDSQVTLSDQGLCGQLWWDVFVSTIPNKSSRTFFRHSLRNHGTERFITHGRLPDDSLAYLEWAMKPVPKEGGGPFVLLIGQDVSSRLAAQVHLARKYSDLQEENKVLACQYRIAQLSLDTGRAFEERLREILSVIPRAFRYPQAVSVHVELDGLSHRTERFVGGPLRLSKRVAIHGRRCGLVEVIYDEQRIAADGAAAAFLPREKRFLEAVARKLALVIERKEADEAEEALKEQVKHADRLATIGQLAAGIAHELNNPLSDILGFAQLAANCPDLPEQTYADIIKIVQSSLYAREVIKKILLFSRQTHLKETTANLNALVKDWMGFIQPRCAQSNIELTLALDQALPDIHGDPSQLNQVLVNLVVNAIHAMPGGGRLTLGTRMDNDGISLAVGDTGTGISEEIRDKIFLPFFTTKDVDKGTGLGLSVVYGIVQEHGATITVDSRVGEGSVFTVTFPLGAVNR